MKLFKLRNICFLFALVLLHLGQAQHTDYNFSHITDADGLSQNSIMAVHQDNLGQIWIGTKDGLNKYNGTEFTVYRHEKDNPTSISNNGIEYIEQDSSGFIWVGTAFGLNKFDPKKNIFKSYFLNNNQSVLGNNMIIAIRQLSNQEIWVCHFGGVSIYDASKDNFFRISNLQLPSCIVETKDGAIYIGTNKGLYQFFRKDNGTFQMELIPDSKGFNINDLLESKNGNILLATKTKSVLEYNIHNKKIQPYFKESEIDKKSKNARKLIYDDNGLLWVATFNGLHIVDEDRNINALYHDGNNNKSLNDNFIKTVFKDNIGTIWVGTYYGGLNIYNRFNNNFVNITQNSYEKGLSFRVVSSIENYKNLMLFGTEGGGVSILNKDTNTTVHLTSKNNSELKSDNIKSLCVTTNDFLWIGTFDKGAFVYNLKTQQFISNAFPDNLKDFISEAGVLKLVQYSDDTILMGTNGKGLLKYNFKKKNFFLFNAKSQPVGLTNSNIKTIMVDSAKNIWLGTVRGLNCITPNNKVKNFVYENDSKIKFEINTIYEDVNKDLWIGTVEDGLFKFTNNQFEYIDLKVGNEKIDGIRSIVRADDNSFWMSTFTQGIVKYNFTSKTVVAHYTIKEGLPSNEFNRDAGLRLGDDFYFGGTSGVTVFNEGKIVKNHYAPQVILTDFKINNQSVLVNDTHKVLQNTISYTKSIELQHHQGNFSLSFSIPSFVNSKSNSYKYRLKGLETNWNETRNNEASYTIQKPGDYVFEVKGVNSNGVINETPTTLNIYVRPAPWFTWWAYAIYILIVISIIYYLYSISKSRTKLKHELELEHLEAEQIKKINQAKLEFFTNISHEFRTPLTLILGPLQQILDNYQGSSSIYKKLQVIKRNSNHLYQLINRLMDFRKYESNQMALQVAEHNIVDVLKKVFESFSDYAISEGYQYNFETPSNEIRLYIDENKLERVFFNLISNAFKYTDSQGQITVKIKEEGEMVLLLVEDDGIGIPEAYWGKIFDRFFELVDNNAADRTLKKGTGIGLAIVKNIVELHKGKISVASNSEGKGSVFKVELFKGASHFKPHEITETKHIKEEIDFYQNQLESTDVPFEGNFSSKIRSDKKMSILLVEDNEELRMFMHNILIDDYNVFEAENGKIAFKMAVKEPIDLIVSDVVMPITTGLELCKLIKEDIRTSHIPVILLTAKSDITHKIEGLQSGADDYISKPFNVQELKLRINNSLKSIQNIKSNLNTHDVFKVEDIRMSSLDETLYNKALDIIEQNISDYNFDIPFFCEALGVSKSVLFTKFKAWADYTPKQFIQHIRLIRAAQLLEKGKANINQVCAKVGFKDQKYFSKSFKAKFGKTPSEYAQSFLEN
ncbi:hybrid sensor histidine kinase/response regulator transcription factor [Seonamhaeicola aphaedonensis]|uniref:histidine kinase n=1 Tax=Seonamhaeicola aphaedonensis TaxID=1461338 RepID=A0A3D9HFN6_9FLAO|nr:two-component regulator propeller domain-containing protein [Seonamhaeicola aphaedonensis]RED47786.1 two component regulator with propeller domain [Seonamhaeicola aphaedonensis]